MRLPETQMTLDLNALKIKHLIEGYKTEFKNKKVVIGGLIAGCGTSIIYVFAATAPFIAINFMGMTSAEFGMASLLPPLGLLIGSLVSAQVSKKVDLMSGIKIGIAFSFLGSFLILFAMLLHLPVLLSLFLPVIFVYFGICFLNANASVYAMSQSHNKAHAAAVMSFINMGIATCVVLGLGGFQVSMLLLPIVYLVICAGMMGVVWLR